MGILYLLRGGFMGTLTDGAPLPGAALPAVLTVGFVLLSFVAPPAAVPGHLRPGVR